MSFIYLDTETTGLDPSKHEAWEAAWAIDDGPIHSGVIAHSVIGAESKALEIGRYHDRMAWGRSIDLLHDTEAALYGALVDSTVVGANPAFDTSFLRARWGRAPWHHRLLDIETYAMPAFGWVRPRGLADVADACRVSFTEIPAPDHTAAGDVATVRACHLALRDYYRRTL